MKCFHGKGAYFGVIEGTPVTIPTNFVGKPNRSIIVNQTVNDTVARLVSFSPCAFVAWGRKPISVPIKTVTFKM